MDTSRGTERITSVRRAGDQSVDIPSAVETESIGGAAGALLRDFIITSAWFSSGNRKRFTGGDLIISGGPEDEVLLVLLTFVLRGAVRSRLEGTVI